MHISAGAISGSWNSSIKICLMRTPTGSSPHTNKSEKGLLVLSSTSRYKVTRKKGVRCRGFRRTGNFSRRNPLWQSIILLLQRYLQTYLCITTRSCCSSDILQKIGNKAPATHYWKSELAIQSGKAISPSQPQGIRSVTNFEVYDAGVLASSPKMTALRDSGYGLAYRIMNQ